MEPGLHNLEREIERARASLPRLGAIAPRPAVVAGVRAAVTAEARRLRARGGWLRAVRALGGVAAAAVLVVGLWGPRAGVAPDADALALVQDWGQALDASGTQLRDTLLSGWARGDRPDAAAEVDELFHTLELSLERFEDL